MGRGRLQEPFLYAGSGELLADGSWVVANSAYRSVGHQADKLSAVRDLKRSSGNAATAAHTLIHPPSCGHLVPICELFRCSGESRPSAASESDHADAYKQPRLVEADELSAAAILRHPGDQLLCGLITKT